MKKIITFILLFFVFTLNTNALTLNDIYGKIDSIAVKNPEKIESIYEKINSVRIKLNANSSNYMTLYYIENYLVNKINNGSGSIFTNKYSLLNGFFINEFGKGEIIGSQKGGFVYLELPKTLVKGTDISTYTPGYNDLFSNLFGNEDKGLYLINDNKEYKPILFDIKGNENTVVLFEMSLDDLQKGEYKIFFNDRRVFLKNIDNKLLLRNSDLYSKYSSCLNTIKELTQYHIYYLQECIDTKNKEVKEGMDSLLFLSIYHELGYSLKIESDLGDYYCKDTDYSKKCLWVSDGAVNNITEYFYK